MPTEYFLPDEDDARVLRVLIEREKKRLQGKGVPYEQDHVPTAPQVYVALVPEPGIPGISITLGTGTGSGAESGTGSNPLPGDGDRVYSAYCYIYEIRHVHPGDGGFTYDEKELMYSGFVEEVHNISTGDIAAGGYVVIKRDKFGRFVTSGAQSSSNRHKAVITEIGGILPEQRGEVQIYRGRPPVAVDGMFEQAWLDWLYVDEGLPEGQRVYIEKFEGDEGYTITEPWC